MNNVFKNVTRNDIYWNCLFASIAHAVMVGKYPALASEQSWDGNNYSFQNLEGGRGTISFSDDCFVVVVQNNVDCQKYNEDVLVAHFKGADDQIVALAENEALQYVLLDFGEEVLPVISCAFWGSDYIFSNSSEEYIIQNAQSMLNPLIRVFDMDALTIYWSEYYDMTIEQMLMVKSIFNRKQDSEELILSVDEKNSLYGWFPCADECVESFAEMKIHLPE